MKGIFLKEFFTSKRQFRLIGIMILIFLICGVVSDSDSVILLTAVLGSVAIISCFSFDEASQWDIYAAVLPLPAKKIVAVRYLLAIGINITVVFLVFIYKMALAIKSGSPMNVEEDIFFCMTLIGAIMIYLSICMPLLYKFGAERGRYLMLAAIITPLAVIVIVNRTNLRFELLEEDRIRRLLEVLKKLSVLIGILFMYISYLISTAIYEKKTGYCKHREQIKSLQEP